MKTFKTLVEEFAAIAANNTTSVPIPNEPVVTKKMQKDYKKKQSLTNLNTGRKIKSTF